MPESPRDRVIVKILVTADAAFLWFGRPDLTALTTNITRPHRWVAAVGSDAAAAVLAQTGLWLCAVWVAVAVLSITASRLPGATGRLASTMARRAVPAVIRRSIAGAVGASIFLAPLAAGAHTPDRAPAASVSVGVSTPSPSRPAPLDAGSWTWPTTPGRSAGSQHPDGDPVPVPVPWPQDPVTRTASRAIVVRPGDCLWAIAAQRLGPQADAHQIATVTKQWYEANKPTIGSDPRLIHPGQHLQAPTEKGHRS